MYCFIILRVIESRSSNRGWHRCIDRSCKRIIILIVASNICKIADSIVIALVIVTTKRSSREKKLYIYSSSSSSSCRHLWYSSPIVADKTFIVLWQWISLELSTPCDHRALVFAHLLIASWLELTGFYNLQLADVTWTLYALWSPPRRVGWYSRSKSTSISTNEAETESEHDL